MSQDSEIHRPDMGRGIAMQPLNVEIFMDCGNFMLAPLNISFIHFLKLKYNEQAGTELCQAVGAS